MLLCCLVWVDQVKLAGVLFVDVVEVVVVAVHVCCIKRGV